MTTPDLDDIAGVAHAPAGTPAGVVVLTHGAGGSRESPLLIRICDEWAQSGWLAVRYNLPYRRRHPKGPPSGSAAADRAGVLEAIEVVRGVAGGPVIAGGHSYGGRQTSMVVAEHPGLVDVLTLFSYPLHPPGKPDRLRTEHFAAVTHEHFSEIFNKSDVTAEDVYANTQAVLKQDSTLAKYAEQA